ncbi:MAG: UDP-3-O-(3-hydroxymyristoyl)glucosamine N-acyltransferase [Gammaproteobacteria bacterium RIFCSPHIGHO2_12_FULL_35_23]|nr:MAG: UDP-3-O-(3-hydroxymyristoyl)glucosamine N-acyltransferase [Gammaproteobacteria bacterium RIFCSPHIGHO2_12_FULL_35_23]
MKKKLIELAKLIDAKVIGDQECEITGIATLSEAKSGDISFFHNPKYKHQLQTTQASAVILSAKIAEICPTNALVVENPYYAYAKLANEFAYKPVVQPGIHPTAIIGKNCQIAKSVSIAPYVVISDEVIIDENTSIGAGSVIGEGCKIGKDCQLAARVTLYHHVEIGDRVLIFSGAVLGSDGFGHANYEDKWYKVSQLGRVIIEDDVEIGANTTIDRGALDDTRVGRGVKLDNQIQIGHNVQIGAHTIMAGCSGIAGSTKIGSYCMIGGGSCINGHIEIVDRVMITGMGAVISSIKQPGIYSSGTGLLDNHEWKKSVIRFRQLDKMMRQLKKLTSLINKE